MSKRRKTQKFIHSQKVDDFGVRPNMYGCTKYNIGSRHYDIDVSNIDYDKLYAHLKLYSNSDINTAPDGVYTWLLIDCNDIAVFFFTKVYNISEIGTKHSHIINRLQSRCQSNIVMHYAGEMIKQGNSVTLNFASGSFMIDVTTETNRESLKNDIEAFLQAVGGKIPVTFSDDDTATFITPERVTLTPDVLKLYHDSGAVITKFDDRETCLIYNRMVQKNKAEINRYRAQLATYEQNEKRGAQKNIYMRPPPQPTMIPPQSGQVLTDKHFV